MFEMRNVNESSTDDGIMTGFPQHIIPWFEADVSGRDPTLNHRHLRIWHCLAAADGLHLIFQIYLNFILVPSHLIFHNSVKKSIYITSTQRNEITYRSPAFLIHSILFSYLLQWSFPIFAQPFLAEHKASVRAANHLQIMKLLRLIAVDWFVCVCVSVCIWLNLNWFIHAVRQPCSHSESFEVMQVTINWSVFFAFLWFMFTGRYHGCLWLYFGHFHYCLKVRVSMTYYYIFFICIFFFFYQKCPVYVYSAKAHYKKKITVKTFRMLYKKNDFKQMLWTFYSNNPKKVSSLVSK